MAETPMPELTEIILAAGGTQLQECMQCGTCSGVCPWPTVKEFSPRHVIRLIAFGLEGYEQEDLWNCVTCNTCTTRCPRGIDIIEVMRAAREVMLEAGTVPEYLRQPLASLRGEGNPWSGERAERYDWAKGLELPDYSGQEYLYFTCCTQSYDPRNRKVGLALAKMLLDAGVDFGVLGTKETCCGDQAHKVGAQELYEELKESNVKMMTEAGVKQVLVSSPHCLELFNKHYRDAIELSAKHYTQLLDELIADGKLKPKKAVPMTVTYHDPCYLGRHAGEYEAPRRVLTAIPELELVEMRRNRETSLCCGGGGGGAWMDLPQEARFAVIRVREAQEAGAKVIATACPYCTTMLTDAIKVMDLEGEIEVMDVVELLALSEPE